MTNGWRYMAQRFDGTGNLGDFVDLNLPLTGVEVEEVLSGDNALSATITPALARLKGTDGLPIFVEWGVAIWAESPAGQIFGGILERSGFDGPNWTLDCVDLTGVLKDTPYLDANLWTTIDPIDAFRYLWVWYQGRPGCNLSITADNTASPVRLGGGEWVVDTTGAEPEAPEAVDLAPSAYDSMEAYIDKAVKKFGGKHGWTKAEVRTALQKWVDSGRGSLNAEQKKIVDKVKKTLGKPPKVPTDDDGEDPTPTAGDPPLVWQENPYRLNWYTTLDMGGEANKLAAETPFDYHLIHQWSDEDEDADLQHHMRIGYPRLGRRLTDLRFVLGENIHEEPSVDRDGEDYANEVFVIGNGEGAAAMHGMAFRPAPGRLRRTKVITDQNLMTNEACTARAEQEIAARSVIEDISELVLIEHPNAPAGSVSLGDEFLLESQTDWMDLSVWVRCIGRRFSPDDNSQMTLTVIRTDRLG